MNIWGAWLATTVGSVVADWYLGARAFKDIAAAGYTIDKDKLDEVKDKTNPNTSRLDYLIKLIPILNLGVAFQKGVKYGKSKEELIKELRDEGALVPMTEEEKEAFRKKPTIFTAIKIVNDRQKEELIEPELVEDEPELEDEGLLVTVKKTGKALKVDVWNNNEPVRMARITVKHGKKKPRIKVKSYTDSALVTDKTHIVATKRRQQDSSFDDDFEMNNKRRALLTEKAQIIATKQKQQSTELDDGISTNRQKRTLMAEEIPIMESQEQQTQEYDDVPTTRSNRL
jgi:hypothetical protein